MKDGCPSIAYLDRFSSTYCLLNIFGTPEGFDVVGAAVLPATFASDAGGLRIRCGRTGKIAGRVVDSSESPWPKQFADNLPPAIHTIRADLADFCEFERHAVTGGPIVAHDLLFEVVDSFGEKIAADLDFAWYCRNTLPMPPAENIARVVGKVGPTGFLFGGATWHARLEKLIRRYLGRESRELERILDWGVGCGRIARHFLERGQTNLYGADIDQVNIDWLHANFGWRDAQRIDFDPPMPYPDNNFDVIYAHSVFTHLTYASHVQWLGELRRVLKPGGMAFLTVTTEDGLYLVRYRQHEGELSRLFAAGGFLDAADQSHVGVDAGKEGYYRLVFHSRRFILDNWKSFFAVQRIMPCYVGAQDLVIVSKEA